MTRIHGGCPGIRLDFSVNLNPLGPPKFIRQLIEEAIRQGVYEAYPDYTYERLRHAIARFYGVKADLVLPCNGAAEALSLTPLALRRYKVITLEPMYGDWAYTSKILGLKWIPVLMKKAKGKFELDISRLESALEAHCHDGSCVLILCNPNNPTGAYIDEAVLDDISRLCRRLNCIIVIDEVYIELCENCKSALYANYENTIIVRSFTKTLSIPGLRAGFVYSQDEGLIGILEAARQPWNVNSIACYTIEKALTQYHDELKVFIMRSARYVREERERLKDALVKSGVTVYESHTNFLLCRFNGNAITLAKRLLDEYGICIRPAYSFYGLDDRHFRISIRRQEENDILVNALCRVLSSV